MGIPTKRHLAMRPAFVAGRLGGLAKPTPVTVGCWSGYSCPIFNSDDEELFWRLHVPGRWDGASDIMYYLLVCLSVADSADETFRFQLSWNHCDGSTSVIDTAAVQDLTADVTLSAGHTDQYSIFTLAFTIDWDIDTPDIVAGDVLGGRVRRVTSGATDITSGHEVIVLDHWLRFQVDKIFKA